MILFCAKCADIIPMVDQVLPESLILLCDSVLSNVRQEHQSDDSAEDAQSTANVEWVLALFDNVVASCLDDVWEYVVPHKSSNFSACCCDAVIHPTNRCCRGLGSYKTNVVSWTDFAERKEDPVDDDKTADLRSLIKVLVDRSHDKSDDSLQQNPNNEAVLGADPV